MQTPPPILPLDTGLIDIEPGAQPAAELGTEAQRIDLGDDPDGDMEGYDGGFTGYPDEQPAQPDPPVLATVSQRPLVRPELVHGGTYALYRTPAGLFHLTYRRTSGTDEDSGRVYPIDGAPDVHLRDLPEHAAMMVAAVMDRDQELPPMLAAFLFGPGNPMAGGKAAIVRQIAGLAKEAGGLDQLIEFAQQGGVSDASPVE